MQTNDRVQFWKSKLLDMGKRNKLLNYRYNKVTSLKLRLPEFEKLFGLIALQGSTAEVLGLDLTENENLNIQIEALEKKLKRGQVITDKYGSELGKSLYQIRSKAKTSIEEQGINILYLAFGFLEWSELDHKESKVLSPLVLVPVELSADSIENNYKVAIKDEDIVINPVLVQKLSNDFSLNLPEIEEEEEFDLMSYISSIEDMVKRYGWTVNREVHLGLFSFLKLSMYKEIEKYGEKMLQNRVIKALAGDSSDLIPLPEEFIEGFNIDEKVKLYDSFRVLDADSSQEEAIIAAREGIDFVLQGPPGTGKSQTIANIIAQAIGDGKKVLFVSEKMAALEVVYNRLKETGLDEFCLELHSYKINKREVLNELQRTLNKPHEKEDNSYLDKLDVLKEDRDNLNCYDESLHTVCEPLGKTIFEVHGELMKYASYPDMSFQIEDIENLKREDLRRYHALINKFSDSAWRMGKDYRENPWYGCTVNSFTLELQHNVITNFNLLSTSLASVMQALNDIESDLCLSDINSIEDLFWLLKVLRELKSSSTPPKSWFNSSLAEYISEASKYKNELIIYKRTKEQIDDKYENEVYEAFSKDSIHILNDVIKSVSTHIQNKNNFISQREEIEAIIEELIESSKKLNKDAQELTDEVLGRSIISLYDVTFLNKLCEVIAENKRFNKLWLEYGNVEIARNIFEDARKTYSELKNEKEVLLEVFHKDILEINASELLRRFKGSYSSGMRVVKLGYHKDKKAVSSLLKSESVDLSYDDIIKYLTLAKSINEKEEYISEKKEEWSKYLGEHYKLEYTNWEELGESIEALRKLTQMFNGGEVPATVKRFLLSGFEGIEKVTAQSEALKLVFDRVTDLMEKVRLNFSETFDNDILDIKLCDITKFGENMRKEIFLPLYVYDDLVSRLKQDKFIDLSEALSDLENIKIALDIEESNKINQNVLESKFGSFYSGMNTDWDLIIYELNWVDSFSKLFSSQNRAIPERLIDIICSNSDALKADEYLKVIENCYFEIVEKLEFLKGIFEKTKLEDYTRNLSKFYQWGVECIEKISSLEDWTYYKEAREECEKYGLYSFTVCAEEENIDAKLLWGAFLKRIYRLWLDVQYVKFPVVKKFRRNLHEQCVSEFKELDKLQFIISRSRIKEKLSKLRPDPYAVTQSGSEMSVLMRELEKRKRIMPIRKLFQKIPELLLSLKPCLLMSPLSVSLYLDPKYYEFDTVIFDEASQICSEDAIGAIFRGKQVIIVGDREQLPPTNFFTAAMEGDEFEEEDISSYESILDECSSILHKLSLRWHYRSRDENLIAFSNAKIYRNLITFPSPEKDLDDMGVEFIYVEDGFYDRSISRTNKVEAMKVAETVFEALKKHPERSLGVIAFSQSQQLAIDAAIRSMRLQNTEFEELFSESRKEAFFIKNLENVQGDERDTIIFSIGYAKDQTGVMYMNFGPLSRQGGYRRLNVAITRAKYNVKVVSSIKPDDIDLERTSSEGVKMLRQYLDFAIRGTNAILGEITLNGDRDFDSPFEKEVYDVLVKNGYEVDIQVGCSGYRIDMAVKHPNKDSSYILGIECDGATYHSARTARERDRLREEVLRQMGWNIYRIWSTDWIKDEAGETQKLLEAVKNAIN